MPDRYGKGKVMTMRGTVGFPKRAGKEFLSFAVALLVAYAVIAAILTLAAGVPLGGVLIVGVSGVPAVAALLAVVSVWAGGSGNPDPGSRPYDYVPGSDPVLRSGGGYGASGGWDGGGGDGGGGGGDGGGL